MVDFPCFAPPPTAVDLPACANWLYDKHVLIVEPSLPIAQDAVGGQIDQYGPSYELRGNIQVSNPEPTDFGPGPRVGKLYTRNLQGVKTRDVVTDQDGVKWRVKGVETPYNHVSRERHHLEADVECITTSVEGQAGD